MQIKAGEEISYQVAYLEMLRAPKLSWPDLPDSNLSLLCSKSPLPRYFLDLYSAVGDDYEWTDLQGLPVAEIEEFLNDPRVKFYTLIKEDWPVGFFILDSRLKCSCDLAYFGLVPEVIGSGLGKFLLKMAVKFAWAIPGIEKLTVNTCSLDHPNALPLYKKMGFKVFKVLENRRILKHARKIDFNNWLNEVRN